MNTDQDAAAILDEIRGEADALIRLRLKDQGLELPHLAVAVTPDNKIVLRSNVSLDVLRSFEKGRHLNNRRPAASEGAPKRGLRLNTLAAHRLGE